MTWAEAMNVNPLNLGLGVLALIMLGAFGINPIRTFSRRATRRNEVEAEEAQARLRAIRRDDDSEDKWFHLAERAYEERDAAIKAKHVAADAAQATLAKMQLESIAEIRKVEKKAEDRIDELTKKIEVRDAEVLRLSKELTTALARVEQLSETLNRRMTAAGFDPTRTNTE